MPAEPLRIDLSGHLCQEGLDHLTEGDVCTAEVQLVEATANRVHGVDFQPFAEPRFVADQSYQSGPQRSCQCVGKGGEQHPGIGMGTGQKDGTVQGHDGLARACRSGYPRGSAIVPFAPLALPMLQDIGKGQVPWFASSMTMAMNQGRADGPLASVPLSFHHEGCCPAPACMYTPVPSSAHPVGFY
jgi:hypothetical protein